MSNIERKKSVGMDPKAELLKRLAGLRAKFAFPGEEHVTNLCGLTVSEIALIAKELYGSNIRLEYNIVSGCGTLFNTFDGTNHLEYPKGRYVVAIYRKTAKHPF